MNATLQLMLSSVGWLATAVFTASYFAKRVQTLRLLQMAGAGLWLLYGVVIHSWPVIVANLLVLAAAAWTARAARATRSIDEVELPAHGHHAGLPGGHEARRRPVDNEGVTATDHYRAPRLQYLAAHEESLARSGSQQIALELEAHHAA